MAAGDPFRVAKKRTHRINIVDAVILDFEPGGGRQPAPHVPGCVNAYLNRSICYLANPPIFDERAGGANALPPAQLLVYGQFDSGLFCQPDNEETIRAVSFQQVVPVADSVTWQGITFTRTPGQHGFGDLAERMGAVSGFVWQAEGEPTVYWVGDSIWYEPIAQIIADVQPDIIITHSGGARFGDSLPIVMDSEMTLAVCQAAPDATVIAVHIEALDHCPVTRDDLRIQATAAGISATRLLIPADGETITRQQNGSFADVIGGWQGEPLQRPPQGDYETRDELFSDD